MHVITANRLADGIVVWLTAGDGWSEDVHDSRVFGPDDLASGLKTAAAAIAARQVVDTYQVEVTQKDGRIVPIRFRERIRALGPTVRLDLGPQSRSTRSAA